ncbi:MAG TPA: DUF1775 domain-containing protein, partial [Nakamurella sp.]
MTRHRHPGRHGRRTLTVAALTLTAILGLAPAAAAHVAVDSASPNGDGTTTVTLAWNHSCTPGTATTGVDVTGGAGVTFTGASTAIPGWTDTVDPRTVTFTGPDVPTGQQVSVAVVARITGTPGSTITFPTVQHCGQAQTGWTDPDPSSDHPVPSLIATAAVLAPQPTTADATSGADITQALTGIVLLAAALGVAGFLV